MENKMAKKMSNIKSTQFSCSLPHRTILNLFYIIARVWKGYTANEQHSGTETNYNSDTHANVLLFAFKNRKTICGCA